jgi:hypothetical protein
MTTPDLMVSPEDQAYLAMRKAYLEYELARRTWLNTDMSSDAGTNAYRVKEDARERYVEAYRVVHPHCIIP